MKSIIRISEPRAPRGPAVLVTGTSTGIGRETTLLLDRVGYRVFASVRNDTDADALRSEASPRLTPVIMDVCNPEQIEAVADQVSRSLRPGEGLAGIVNNAGICVAGPL